MINGQSKPQDNPKLKQFVEELNALQDRYLYTLTPVLSVTPQGIVPGIKITDKIPPKAEVKLPVKADVPTGTVTPEAKPAEKPAEEKPKES